MPDSPASTTDAPEAPVATTAQRLAAEGLGTFVLVLVGCASIAVPLAAGGTDLGLIAFFGSPLTFGLTYAVLGYAFGRHSGAHFNPAVSVGSALAGRLTWKDAATYAGVQLAGGILAALVLLVLLLGFDGFEAFDDSSGSLGANSWGDDGSGYAWWATILLELVVTAIFVLVHLASYDRRGDTRAFAPLATGLALTAIYFATLPATGGAANPARSFGPALFSGSDPLIQVGLFIVAPLLGALAAGLAYPALFGRDGDAVPGSGLSFSRPARTPKSGAAGGAAGGTPGYDQSWQQGGYAAGYQQPQQGYQGYAAPAAGQVAQGGQGAGAGQHAAQAQPEQPIIQDGWQWDPQAQQWIPAQQQPGQGNQGQGGDWGGGGQTQIR